jgi:DNA polymerase
MTASSEHTLFADIETYSSADLARGGVRKYTEAPDFDILLMSYAWDDEPVRVWDFTADGPPPWLREALLDETVLKVAWNISFERTCFNRYFDLYTPPEQWRDAMTLAAMNGLPMSLEAAGAALRLTEQKLDTGKALINYFCKPCRPTKTNGGRTRNLPEHAPDKWQQFITYCGRDTEVERTIYKRLIHFPVTATERRVEWADARINERGVMIDRQLVASAIRMDDAFKAEHMQEMQRLTGLENPNSLVQLKAWLATRGLTPETLDKKAVTELLGTAIDPTTRRVLRLRQLLGKSSTAKYTAMEEAVCNDGRIRGLLQYYGAGRTGRWAGRRVQLQNLAQNHLDQIDLVRDIVKHGDLEGLELIYDNVPDVLSQLIRTALIAKDGHTFLVADYHAIEAVCIAYLAGEGWRLNVFAGDGKIYEASYAQAFGVPKESVKKGTPERQKGKIMELALGYGGGPSALLAFGADKLGLEPEQLQELVDRWRAASPKITAMWRACEKAAKAAIRCPGKAYRLKNACTYLRDRDALRLILPSGRRLSYWGAWLDEDSGSIRFLGQNQTTRKWERMETWGGRLVENIVQAYARDILAEAILRLEAAGFPVVFSVHDECIVEAPEGTRWQDMAEIMGQPVSWAPGLDKYLHADGYETIFYRKD